MNHKKALKKLMGIGIDRNTAKKLLRKGMEHGHTYAWVVVWQTNVYAVIQFVTKNPHNWCYFRE